jgi:tungstate transport system ATP-binding protein
MDELLRLENVSVSMRGAVILRNVSLSIAAGERVVILGANGAGKSTLLRVAHGLIAPASGTLQVNKSAQQAMLFQRPPLLKRSVAEQVAFSLAACGRVDAGAVGEALTACGLTPLAARACRSLSGGEQQRLALACAWVMQPRLLFADEPTASVDVNATRDVERLLRALNDQGVALLMSTHSLAQAKRLAQRIVFVHAGRITDDGPAAQFFAGGRSAEASAFFEGERV